jgi:mannitol/fructose-specific phosphotransferase system IIA component (Ntr-type)
VLIAFGHCPEGVDFGASDGVPARFIVALVSPTDSAGQHLAVLARLSALLLQESVRRAIAETRDPAALLRLLEAEDDRYEKLLQARGRQVVKPA